MNKKTVFEILEIEETKDEAIIKSAYRKKLVVTNPEDKPEEFKALRQAYEEALRLSKIEDDEIEEAYTPIGRWIKKVEKVYNSLSNRGNLDSWKRLFQEDICINFDTNEEARDALLVFLMDNYRLGAEIWKLINDTFNLSYIKEEVYEKFPRDFVDFVVNAPETEGWFDYNLLKGKKKGI